MKRRRDKKKEKDQYKTAAQHAVYNNTSSSQPIRNTSVLLQFEFCACIAVRRAHTNPTRRSLRAASHWT